MKFSVTKTVDSLGIIVIPKEMRKYYGFSDNDKVRLIPMDSGILVTKKEVFDTEDKGNIKIK